MNNKSMLAIGLCFVLGYGCSEIKREDGGMFGISINKEDTLETDHISGKKKAKHKILVVNVKGPISNSAGGGGINNFMGGESTNGDEFEKTLEKAANTKEIEGIVVNFSTPGGTVSASAMVYQAIVDYKAKTKKPVYAHIEGICASGGVMAMVGADKIFADRGSVIGSIGVTLGTHPTFNNVSSINNGVFGGGVETKDGINFTTYSAGRSKDIFNPYRKPNEEEIKAIVEMLTSNYQYFVEHVMKNRNMSAKTIIDDIGALIFNESKAIDIGLIDGVATKKNVINMVREKLNLNDDEYEVVSGIPENKKGFIKSMIMGWLEIPTMQTNSNFNMKNDMNGVLALYNPREY